MTSLAPVETSPATVTSGIIRVMVVDDSAVVRGLVSRWVDEDPGMETVGRFSNGQLALAGIVGAARTASTQAGRQDHHCFHAQPQKRGNQPECSRSRGHGLYSQARDQSRCYDFAGVP